MIYSSSNSKATCTPQDMLVVNHTTKFFIRNMVCFRCKMAVQVELKKMGLKYVRVDLGEVEVMEPMSAWQIDHFKIVLIRQGLELIDNEKSLLIERIKNVVIQMVYHTDETLESNISIFISETLGYDYAYLANIFSEVQGTSIEKFINAHKIERIKELLVYDEFNISEIAGKLRYRSVAHLSHEFKKTTGLTPSYFRHLKVKRSMRLQNMQIH